jgi:hypothetical protein
MRTNGSLLNGLCPLNGKFNPAMVKTGNFHEIPEKCGTKCSPLGAEPTKESTYACQWYVHELVNIKTTCLCDIN